MRHRIGARSQALLGGQYPLVVGTAALAVVLAQQWLVRGARSLGRAVPIVAGLLLVVVGTYVAWYGWWEIRVLGGGATDDPVIAGGSCWCSAGDAATT